MRRLLSLSVLILLVCSHALQTRARGADWPQFRGPNGVGASEADAPVAWSASSNVKWKARLPGPGASSPIVLGDRVYVTCYSGYGVSAENPGEMAKLVRHLICLNRADGKEIWKTDLPSQTPEAPFQAMMTQHGYASNTPATDGERIYVFLGTAGVVACDMAGKEQWRTSVGTKTDQWGSASSVVLTDKLVIVSAAIENSALVALNKTDGKKAWQVEISRRSWSTPALVPTEDGRQELVVSVQDKILGLDPASGKELWSCEGISDYTCPAVVPGKGVAYVSGGRSNQFFAVRTGGTGDVTKSHILWRQRVGANVTSPVLLGDYLVGVSDRAIAYCVDAKSGEIKYQQRLGGGDAPNARPAAFLAEEDAPPPRDKADKKDGDRGPERRGPGGRGPGGRGFGGPGGPGGRGFGGGRGGLQLYASVVAAGDKVYAVTRTEGTFVITAGPKYALIGQNKIDTDKTRFDGTPAISDGKLYLRSNEYLYCIGE